MRLPPMLNTRLTVPDAQVWRDGWSAGHGIATIHDVLAVEAPAQRPAAGYRAACAVSRSAAVAV